MPKDKLIEDLDIYHGEINNQEAKERLEDQPIGAYLIRYSKTANAYYASVKTKDGVVEPKLREIDIINLKTPDFENPKIPDYLRFEKALIASLNAKMSVPYTKSEYQANESNYLKKMNDLNIDYNHGTLDRDKAWDKLKDKPDGTCLLRYSTNKKSHVLTIKTGKSVEEIILYKQSALNLPKYTDINQFINSVDSDFSSKGFKAVPLSKNLNANVNLNSNQNVSPSSPKTSPQKISSNQNENVTSDKQSSIKQTGGTRSTREAPLNIGPKKGR